MTSLNNSASHHDTERAHDEQTRHDNQSAADWERSAEDLPQMAAMVASGELPIPVSWPPDRLLALLERVHELRRRRLVALIARAIASDLCRKQRQEV